MPRDDFSNDTDRARWMPEPGEYRVEVVTIKPGTSATGNPKYTISFADATDASNGIEQDLTNIPGKRWLLRQLLEACGVEPEIDAEGKKIYDWEYFQIEGKTVTAKIEHERSRFINRDGNEQESNKAKIVAFKK